MGTEKTRNSIFGAIFGKKRNPQAERANILNLLNPFFSENSNPKLNDTFMSCVQAHMRHVSKFKPVVYLNEEPAASRAKLNRILQLRPNPTMNATTFYEKLAYAYFAESNVFIYVERELDDYQEAAADPIKALWPLDPTAVEVRMGEDKQFYLRFSLQGQEIYTSLDNVIHVARNVNNAEFFGEKNDAIRKILRVMNTNYEGIENAVKSSAFIRFLVQSATVMNEEIKKEKVKAFAESYLGKDSTGIAYVDGGTNIIPVESKAKYANADEMKFFEDKIYSHLGISDKILKATFTEDEWQAYYESSIEPFALKLEEELTYKLFTAREIELGNRILIDPNRLQSASLQTRVKVAMVIQKLPTYIPNVINDLLYMPRTKHGDKEFSTLNYVDANKQNQYQGVGGKEEKPKDETENENNEEGKPNGSEAKT